MALGFRVGRPCLLHELVDPVDEEGQCLAHVAEEDFQVSVLVEEFACEETEDVQGHFAVPVEAVVGEEV